MPQVKHELVLINSNENIVTGSTQRDINPDLHGTTIDEFRLGEVTSVENIDNGTLVPISYLPKKIHTVQQENEDTLYVKILNCKKELHSRTHRTIRW